MQKLSPDWHYGWARFPIDSRIPEHYPMPGLFVPLLVPPGPIHLDQDLARYRRCKVEVADRDPGRCGACTADFDAARRAEVLAWLGRQLADDSRVVRPAASPGALSQWMLQLQEDLVVLVKDAAAPAAEARVAYVHVCFPSGWAPEEALGRDFEQIHAPVPSHDRFIKDAGQNLEGRGPLRRRLAGVLFGRRPLVRFAWTVTPDPGLDRHRDRPPRVPWTAARTAFLRVERQVIVPLGAQTSAFLIRIYVTPIGALQADQRASLGRAVAALPPQVAAYKGLLAARPRILALIARS